MSYPDNEKLALGRWASSKYALSNGYPIPQWRLGIKWFIGNQGDITRDPPYLTTDVQWVEKLPNGNYLVADPGQDMVFEVAPDYEVKWKYESTDLSGEIKNAQFLPDKDSVLISDTGNGRIIQVDRDTKSVEHELTSTDLGALGDCVGRWHGARGYLEVVDETNHVFTEVDWDGAVNLQFGEYGTPGSDTTHLDSPRGVTNLVKSTPAVITDRGNHRTLAIDDAGDMSRNLVTPYPTSAHVPYRPDYFPGSTQNVLIGSGVGTILASLGGGVTRWGPRSAIWASLSEQRTMIFGNFGHAWEMDMRTVMGERPEPRYPHTDQPMDSVSLDANASGDVYPFYPFMSRHVTVKALTTQDATLDVYTLRVDGQNICASRGAGTATWDSYYSKALTADEPFHYSVSDEGMLTMAAQITMGGTAGDASLWIHKG